MQSLFVERTYIIHIVKISSQRWKIWVTDNILHLKITISFPKGK